MPVIGKLIISWVRGAIFYRWFCKHIVRRLLTILYNLINGCRLPTTFYSMIYEPLVGHSFSLQHVCEKVLWSLPRSVVEWDGVPRDEFKFQRNVDEFIPHNLKHELVKVIREDFAAVAERHLGFSPLLCDLMVYATYPSKPDIFGQGSMLYHLDSDVDHTFEIFFLLHDVGENDGPLNVYHGEREEHLFPIQAELRQDWKRSGRYTDSQIQVFIANAKKYSLIGGAGSYIGIDAGRHYHGGGAVKNGCRLIGRAIFAGGEYHRAAGIRSYTLFLPERVAAIRLLITIYRFMRHKVYRCYSNCLIGTK